MKRCMCERKQKDLKIQNVSNAFNMELMKNCANQFGIKKEIKKNIRWKEKSKRNERKNEKES
jgi:hypothetical protein